jgi:predicted nucleic acid-binding protein
LDADVLIGALDRADRHHARARELISGWGERGDEVLVSVVNLSEVLVAPATEPRLLRRARAAIAALGVICHTPNEEIAIDAARLRARHPISLPDGYLLATARHIRAPLVSFDRRLVRAAKSERISWQQ